MIAKEVEECVRTHPTKVKGIVSHNTALKKSMAALIKSQDSKLDYNC
jgi:hypothetical protein